MLIKQEIWLASYLVKERFGCFKRALKSFKAQTLRVPIVISVTGPECAVAAECVSEVLRGENYELILNEERMSQFDQLALILKNRKKLPEGGTNERLFISVCDDDDWFEPNRVEVQQKHLEEKNSEMVQRAALRCGVLGVFAHQDFGCFCFDLRQLEWFIFTKEGKSVREMFRNVAPDVSFCASLQWINIPEKLHNRDSATLWSRTYNEDRVDGLKWFSLTV
jgi:hypothetical protein